MSLARVNYKRIDETTHCVPNAVLTAVHKSPSSTRSASLLIRANWIPVSHSLIMATLAPQTGVAGSGDSSDLGNQAKSPVAQV